MSDYTEIIPGRVSGVSIVKGTRIPVLAIIDNFDAGASAAEIAEFYEGLDAETVRAVIQEYRVAHPV